MKNSINPRGYYIATLCINGKPRSFSLHRLIALQFIPNDDPKNKTQEDRKSGVGYARRKYKTFCQCSW